MVQHLHAQSGGDVSYAAAYAAEAEYAEGLARQIFYRIGKNCSASLSRPAAVCDKAFETGNIAHIFKQHGENVLRHALGGIARHVAHGYSPPFCGFDIHIVIARCKQADKFESGTRGNELFVHPCLVYEKHLGLAAGFRQFVAV